MLFFFLGSIVCFCTDIGQDPDDLAIGHGVSLVEIAGRGGKLAIRTAKLKKDIIKSHEKGLLF